MYCRKETNRWAPSQIHLFLVPLPCQLKSVLLISLLEIQMAKLLWLQNPDGLPATQRLQMDLLGCC